MATLSMPQLVALARGAGFRGEDAATMAAIGMAESGGNSLAHNPNRSTGDNSYGPWQVNMIEPLQPERLRQFGISRNEELFDPAVNVRAARKIWESQGFGAWSVHKSGKYLDYLPQARAALAAPAVGTSPSTQPAFAQKSPARLAGGNPLEGLMKELVSDALSPGGLGTPSAAPAGGAPRQPGSTPAANNIRELSRDEIKKTIIGGLLGHSLGSPGAASLGGSGHRMAAGDPFARALALTQGRKQTVSPGGGAGDDSFDTTVNGLIAGIFSPKSAAAPQPAAAASSSSPGRGSGSWGQGPAIAAFHAETGSGYTIPGARDANGRPAVFSKSAANAFAAMMRDSGGLVKPSDLTSAQRSESKNAAVGGAVGSQHLGGNAMDIHGGSHDWIANNGARYGWHLNRYGGPGDHGGHFEFRG